MFLQNILSIVIVDAPVFICAIVGAVITYLSTPWLIRYLVKLGLVVKDQNKKDKPLVPLSGGLAVFSGFFSGTMFFIFFRTFFQAGEKYVVNFDSVQLVLLFAAVISIFIVTVVGFLDDLLIKKKDSSYGLKQWQKPLLTLTAAIPLMVVNAGSEYMYIPFFGEINLGIIYPLLFIPLAVVGAANMINLLAGFNGLEAGMGIVYLFSLGFYTFYYERYIASLIALMAFTSLLVFFFYNKYPSKIFPGDSLTYFLGGVLACIAIIGNVEKAALIVSIPFFVEFFLKARSRFKAQCYGKWVDGKVKTDYEKIYSLTHIFTRSGKFSEKQIVFFFILMEVIFSLLIWVV